jgi:pyruvate dehydrogenase complex dehydrogenase (E1) component
MKLISDAAKDIDAQETTEWLESLEAVIEHDGVERARYLLRKLSEHAARTGAGIPHALTTPFCNTIPTSDEPAMAGDPEMERHIESLVRWNALVTVMRANMNTDDLGGHISTFQSVATLYGVGFNYFWRATRTRETWWTSRVILRPGCMRAHSLRGVLPSSSWTVFAARSMVTACLPIRIPG